MTKKKKLSKIKLTPAAPGQEEVLFVACNGIGYRVRRGVWVEVPAEIAEILGNAGIEGLL